MTVAMVTVADKIEALESTLKLAAKMREAQKDWRDAVDLLLREQKNQKHLDLIRSAYEQSKELENQLDQRLAELGIRGN